MADWNRGCFRRNDVANPPHHSHRPSSEGEELYSESGGQSHFLDHVLSCWTTACGAFVFLRVAGEVWECGKESGGTGFCYEAMS